MRAWVQMNEFMECRFIPIRVDPQNSNLLRHNAWNCLLDRPFHESDSIHWVAGRAHVLPHIIKGGISQHQASLRDLVLFGRCQQRASAGSIIMFCRTPMDSSFPRMCRTGKLYDRYQTGKAELSPWP